MVEVFQDQDQEYLAWLTKNPDGFVASYERPVGAYHRLHRVDCKALAHMPLGSTSQTREYFKYCGASIAEVDAAAKAAGLPDATVCGTCHPRSGKIQASAKRNPPWRREELILALHHYFTEPKSDHGKGSPKLQALSQLLNSLPYHANRGETFRNPASCEMKLSNFRAIDPSEPGVGLTSFSQADRKIWEEFATDLQGLAREAERVRVEGVALPAPTPGMEPDPEEELYAEGRLYARMHFQRERHQGLPDKAKRRFQEKHGRLFCEACGFDFVTKYGDLGKGFIEAHHTKPVSEMAPGEKTRLADMAMVCANCHRMLHIGKGLTVEALRERLQQPATLHRGP